MTRRHMTSRRRSGSGSLWILEALGSLLCVLWTSSAAAQILTLEEIEARALKDRAELAVSRASIARAQAELAVVEARSGPTFGARIEGSVAPGGTLVSVNDANSPTADPSNTYLVQGSRPITDIEAFI